MDELLDFTGKVALITGAGGGFGRLLAQGLAKRGCKLVISDINQQT
jgi:NAD(P)-dependent dehydrogenase (short-subunit alcohol dehydrogenase family)